MKTKLFFLLATLFSVALYSQDTTQINEGQISGTWTLAGSPYLIMCETTIPNDSTLTIEPGVRVEWQGSYTMWVEGRILAQGTESDSIAFTAADTSTGWRSIRFEYTPASNDTSRFEFCVFRYGKVYGDYPDNCGGAIGVLNFNKLVIDHCLFDRNEATDISLYPNPGGGAIGLDSSSPAIRNSRFTNNLSLAGGAVICSGESHASIYNNEFTGNTVIQYGQWGQGFGGALCIYDDSHPTVSYNTFSNNIAETSGGAIACVDRCNPVIDHSLIFDNEAGGYGGGIEILDFCSPVLRNNTVANNYADNGGGVDAWTNSNPTIRNTILWGNSALVGNQVNINDPSCVPNFYYCDIEGGQAAFGGSPHTGYYENCMDADPVFEDPTLAYYSLMCELSPCKNTGDPDPVYNDPDGTRNDMGAIWPPVYCLRIPDVESADLSVFPNPVQSEAFVECELVQPSAIRITLFNQLGQEIREVPMKINPAGKLKINIDFSSLPKGIYIIRLQYGIKVVTRKIVKL